MEAQHKRRPCRVAPVTAQRCRLVLRCFRQCGAAARLAALHFIPQPAVLAQSKTRIVVSLLGLTQQFDI